MHPEWGKITAGELIGPIQGTLVSGKPDIPFAGLSTDSRKARSGELFWALKGDKYDGHDFVEDAVRAGVSGVVVATAFLPHLRNLPGLDPDTPAVLTVEDTLKALGDLACWWRRRYRVSVIAITGSAGKTTTKEMTAHILKRKWDVLKSQGNFNNLIGVPLTLIRIVPGVSRVVLELGMNRQGEIARLTQIVDPDVGVITNVGKAHLEGLGNIEEVARAKTELIAESSPDAPMVVNGDDRLLMDTARRYRQEFFTFGLGPQNHVSAENVKERGMEGVSFTLRYGDGSWPVHLKVPGRHNMQNALAAAAVGFVLGAGPEQVVAGLEAFEGMKGRFTVERLACGVTVIDDTYNANPTALAAALEAGKSMIPRAGRLLVALGDMLELGDAAPAEHAAAGRLVADAGAAYVVVMGEYGPDMVRGAREAGFPESRISVVKTHEQMVKALEITAREGDIVFFKASRLLDLGKAVEMFRVSMERKRTADAL